MNEIHIDEMVRQKTKKNEIVRIRVTVEQKRMLIEAADMAGARGVSTWLLSVGLREAENRSAK